MAEWSREASEYLDGYLKQVSVLVRQQGDDSDDVVSGLRDHISNEVESDGAASVTLDRLLQVLGDLGTPEEVASIDLTVMKSTPARAPLPVPAPPVPPVVPRVTKSVVVHRSPLSCVVAVILAGVAALFSLAVLGIIASVMLPAVARAREAARRAECQNNLKQVGLVMLMHATEHDGRVPSLDLDRDGVMFELDQLYPELLSNLQVLACPSSPHDSLDDAAILEGDSGFIGDYLLVTHVVTSPEEFAGYLLAVDDAKRTGVPLADEITLEDGTILPRIRLPGSNAYNVPDTEIPMIVEWSFNHFPRGFNVLYLDGHVEFGRVGEGFPWSEELAVLFEQASGSN